MVVGNHIAENKELISDMSFPRYCVSMLWFSGMWCHVVWQVGTSVLEESFLLSWTQRQQIPLKNSVLYGKPC